MDRRHGVVMRFHSNMLDVIDSDTRGKYLCTLRGRFKKQRIRPIVGDIVEYIGFQDGKGRIENILPRKNELERPHIANIDQIILVATVVHPALSRITLDKFLILAESQELECVIVFNKADLLDEESLQQLEAIADYYARFYTIQRASAKTGEGIEPIKTLLEGRISTMAGMSGVGKSSLLNRIDPMLKLKEGVLSEQVVKGKHTTTYSELLPICERGLIADTPGFAHLDLRHFNKHHIKFFFPDFLNHSGRCSFSNCSHIDEPGCGVKEAVENAQILKSRYENYRQIYQEVSKK